MPAYERKSSAADDAGGGTVTRAGSLLNVSDLLEENDGKLVTDDPQIAEALDDFDLVKRLPDKDAEGVRKLVVREGAVVLEEESEGVASSDPAAVEAAKLEGVRAAEEAKETVDPTPKPGRDLPGRQR